MKYKTILFDMDGTVLYTLPDLCDSVNYSLAQFGYAPITIEQTRRYVGNASRRLIEQAAPDADSETVDRILDFYKPWYAAHCSVKTRPYDGIPELLRRLHGAGHRLAIVSNKPQTTRNRIYGVVALAIAILAPAFLCFTIFGVRERRDDLREAAPPISLKKIFSTFTHNDQLMWIALIFLIQQIGNGIVVGGLGSTYIYFDFGYEGGLYSLFSTVGLAATGFLMIFYPAISRRIKRKKLMGLMMIISTVGYVLMLAPGLVMSAGTVKFIFITGGYMLANFGQYCYYLIMMISIINTVEYNELLTGSRDEAIIASLRPFTTKLASALTVAITSASYFIFGVTGFTNKISALEQSCSLGAITEADKLSQIDAVLAGVQHGQTAGLLLCMTVLPCALMFVSYLLYIKKYRLDEEEYERICVELQVREAQQ